MSKIESKIKRASEFIEGYPERLSNAQYRYIIYAIIEAQRQAIEAAKEQYGKLYDLAFANSGEGWNGEYPFEGCDPNMYESYQEAKADAIASIIDSPELKVI